MNRFLAELRVNMKRTVRLRFFRPVARRSFKVSKGVTLAVLAASLAAKALHDYAAAGPEPFFNEWGFVTAAAFWGVFAIGLAMMSGRRAPVPLSRAISDLAGIAMVNSMLLFGLTVGWIYSARLIQKQEIPAEYVWFAGFWLISIWSLTTMMRAGSRLWPEPFRFSRMRFFAAVLLPVALIPRQSLFDGPNTDWTRHDIWYHVREALFEPDDEANLAAAAPAIDYEATLYRQPAMVGEALADLKPPSGDEPQIYFVGLAASSEQTVFKSELLGAQSAFESHFFAKGHSLIMVNSQETLGQYPLATMSNLDLALTGIAKVMRPDKDVLALFVTSHGNVGKISVSLPGFPLNMMEPEHLARLLAKSGIKNRVIILSACYSGSFIPALAGDDTLVMTAASAVTTSFGCSNQREWTYFGDALFNHAMNKTTSLPKAFNLARDMILKWESEQGLAASNPQLSLGKNIGKLLNLLETTNPQVSVNIY